MLKNFVGMIAMAASFSALAQQLPELTRGCLQELVFEPRLAGIADKVALTGGVDTTPSMRTLDRVPTAEERQALELWAHFRQQCFDYGRATSTPAQVALAARVFGAEQKLLAELRQGRSTYAQFNSFKKRPA